MRDLQSRFGFDAADADAFAAYDAAHPEVYAALRQFALAAKRSGRARIGIKMLYERARWHSQIEAKDDTFKLNNNYHAFYARKLMAEEPELREFFETRKARADE